MIKDRQKGHICGRIALVAVTGLPYKAHYLLSEAAAEDALG
jgi:hypothetical protein